VNQTRKECYSQKDVTHTPWNGYLFLEEWKIPLSLLLDNDQTL